MKIVHLSKNDLSGGAARAAYRLHQGLRLGGHDSVMMVESRTSDDPSVVAFAKPMDTQSLVMRGIRQELIGRAFKDYRRSRPPGYDLFSDDRSLYASTLVDQLPASQIVNLHWIPGFVDYRAFFSRVPRSRSIVWTFHDLNALTGGCHYDFGCDRYVAGCGSCPQLGSADPGDLSRDVWERKRRMFSNVPVSRLHIVAPSRWLANEARHSPFLGRFQVDVIPYGLDLEEF